MTTTTLTSRDKSIRNLIEIRDSAAADLAAAPAGRNDEFVTDRRREIEFVNAKLARMGVTPEEIRGVSESLAK